MTVLRTFLLARFNEDEKAINDRDLNLPIHFVGCYYYGHTLDANLYCDCNEDGAATKKALAEIAAKRNLVNAFTGSEQTLIVAILAKPYADHPEVPFPLA